MDSGVSTITVTGVITLSPPLWTSPAVVDRPVVISGDTSTEYSIDVRWLTFLKSACNSSVTGPCITFSNMPLYNAFNVVPNSVVSWSIKRLRAAHILYIAVSNFDVPYA